MNQDYELYEELKNREQNTSITATEIIVKQQTISASPLIERLIAEIKLLRERYEEIEKRVDKSEREKPRILYYREVSFEEAKELVSDYLREHKKARVSEIAENLEIDVETVFSVLHQLKEEGRIE